MKTSPHQSCGCLPRGGARAPTQRLAQAGLWVLSLGYGLALQVHLAGYRLGLARRRRLPAVVISVGNLTVGGTGKTTAAMAVAQCLVARGRRVAVLSRGYRGAGERQSLVVSEGFGPLVPWPQSGDEAYLLARALPGASVLVGRDRRETGRHAVAKLGAQILVLDDGFQYQRVHKDIEVVLVDALAPFGYDFLVPRGLLRVPVRHLRRADAVWITHCDLVRPGDVAEVRARVEQLAPRARVWETVHAPVHLRRLDAQEEREPEALRGREVCALSGLGNPLAFERTLERLGANLIARARFPDHHPYRAEELRQLARGPAAAAGWIVTTEKDAVRLPEGAWEKPTWALGVALAARGDGPGLWEELSCLLEAKRGR